MLMNQHSDFYVVKLFPHCLSILTIDADKAAGDLMMANNEAGKRMPAADADGGCWRRMQTRMLTTITDTDTDADDDHGC